MFTFKLEISKTSETKSKTKTDWFLTFGSADGDEPLLDQVSPVGPTWIRPRKSRVRLAPQAPTYQRPAD